MSVPEKYTEKETQDWQDKKPYVSELATIAPAHFGIEAGAIMRPDGAFDRNMLFIVEAPRGKFALRIYDALSDIDHIRSEIFRKARRHLPGWF